MSTTHPQPFTVNGRYQITERPLGEGSMGVIYKAYDIVTKRFVALKTISADASPATIDLFEREWTVLARLSHPNIVDILDTSDWVFDGERRPYFVMPLLPGRTLEEIIETSADRLSIERTVDIISQACRGLQAAHDQNLIHRDIKPSNIFVMEDDTVKIIDFGVVQLSDGAATRLKGTPLYMAPELLQMKPATPLSDIFALATVCYETLTGRKPFARETPNDIAEAIRTYIPPAASEINPAVSQPLSRTVHKAMAKQPWHRFQSAREFGDTLQKALRNEPIERFERSKILPRIERVKRAYAEGDYQFALEILKELESEGHVDPDMSILHIQIEQALRQKNIRRLLDDARIRMDEEEFPLALHKVADVLAIDLTNIDALALKEQIEHRRDELQVSHWFRLVRDHLDNQLFGQARHGLQEILKVDSSNTEAREMLASIDQTEHEIGKTREEKQRLYASAVASYRDGEVSAALTHLERAIAMMRRSAHSTSPDLDAQCQSFYASIRGERDAARNAYQEGRDYLAARNVTQALAICDEYLAKHPGDLMFQALQLEAEEVQRDERSAAIAEVSKRVDSEPDLDRKHKILEAAVENHPDEPHFRSSLKLIGDRRELLSSIVGRARQYEERGQVGDALGQFEILRNIYPLFRGLESEMERLRKRKEDQAKLEEKARWIEQIEGHLHAAEYDKALAALPEALAAFPDDKDLLQRQTLAEQGVDRNAEANILLKDGQELTAARNFPQALESLRKAERLDPRNRFARAALMSGLVAYARELMPKDWHAAEPVVKEALDLDPTDPVARSLLAVLDDNRRQAAINIILAGARNYQADGHLTDALQIVERGLVQYPNDHRLIQFFNTLRSQAGQPLAPAVRTSFAGSLPPASQPESVYAGPDSALISAFSIPLPAAQSESPSAEAPASPVVQQNLFAPPLTELPPSKQFAAPSELKAAPTALPPPNQVAPRTPPLPPAPAPPPLSGPLNDLRLTGPIWAIAFVVAVAVILGAGVYSILYKPEPSSGSTADGRTKRSTNPETLSAATTLRFPVTLESNVADTHFTEEGQPLEPAAKLTAGIHNIDAFHEGYLPENKSVTVDPTATPFSVKFDLRAILPQLRVSSSIAQGRLVIDDAESLDLQSGVASKEDIPLGPHTVKIYDGPRQVFSFNFNAKANERPLLSAPLAAQPVAGAVVASLSGSATVYATPTLRAASALPLAPVPAAGLLLAGTTSTPARFLLDSGKGRGPQEQSVDPSAFPTLNIQLGARVEAASLAISSNVPNCQIMIDGVALKRPMQGQSASLPMSPGNHPVRLTCPAYQDMEKTVLVKPDDGGPQKLDFALLPVPVTVAPVRRAVFTLAGAPPEALVFQNQIRVGTVAADGTFSKEIDPGTFTWEWRKTGFESRKEIRTVKAGDSIRLDGLMTPSVATFTLKASPEETHISLRRDSDNSLSNIPNNQAISLPPGSYHVSAQAPEYRDRTEQIVIAGGKPLSLAWDLEKLPTLSGPVRFFENGDSWKPYPDATDWWVHSGSAYSTLHASTGAFGIDFLKRKGRSHKINLLADCEDHANCIIYSVDAHNFSTKVISGNSTILDEKKPHGMDSNASLHFLFEMSPDGIVVKNQAGAILSSVERQNPHGKLAIQDETPLKIE